MQIFTKFANILSILMLGLGKKIEISKGFKEDEASMQEAFLKLSDEERFIVACDLSEIMIRIQYENGVLPKNTNFTMTNE